LVKQKKPAFLVLSADAPPSHLLGKLNMLKEHVVLPSTWPAVQSINSISRPPARQESNVPKKNRFSWMDTALHRIGVDSLVSHVPSDFDEFDGHISCVLARRGIRALSS